MVRREQLANGRSRCTAAANFQARIVRDIILDDGTEERREFGMEAELGGRRVTFVVAAAEFGRMGWVLSRLGPQAIVYPGGRLTDRATPGDSGLAGDRAHISDVGLPSLGA